MGLGIVSRFPCTAVALCAALGPSDPAGADEVHADDVIVQGSLCAGSECVLNENFGSDTLRLHGPVLRIHFDDTSSPKGDWRIVVNDEFNGGSSWFSIVDASGGRNVFTVEAGARAHALYVDDAGFVGVGTNAPETRVHLVDPNTPTLRFQQTSDATFAPYVWDIGGNEFNWFLRDVTDGSEVPFKVLTAAGSNTLVLAGGGNVGIGTNTPQRKMHISSDDDAVLMIEDVSPIRRNNRILLELINKGASQIAFRDTDTLTDWRLQNFEDSFRLTKAGTGKPELLLDAAGNLVIAGALTQSSDRHGKTDVVPVDVADVLARVASLPVNAWTYRAEAAAGIRHIGPMAQDFFALFGTGASGTGISSLDVAGVALAAIQALHLENAAYRDRLAEQDAAIERILAAQRAQTARMAAMMARLHDLEARQ